MAIIQSVACMLSDEQRAGYYRVRTLVKCLGVPGHDQCDYISLSWREAMDVITSTYDNNRPGWSTNDACTEPTLPFEGDDAS